jgi:hypothetical protein
MRARDFIVEFTEKGDPHGQKRQPDYVLGKEVEHTPAEGEQSIFITKIDNYDDIVKLAKETGAKQLYFEFIHAIRRSSNEKKTIKEFHKVVEHFLKLGYTCGLDTPAEYAEFFVDLHKYPNLINNIAVDLPYIDKYNKNTVFKLRDKGFDQGRDTTNKGVYTMPLDKLTTDDKLTPWSDFGGDTEAVPGKKNTP